MTPKQLDILRGKIRQVRPTEYGGYLTPVEMVYVLGLLPRLNDHQKQKLKWEQENVAKGTCQCGWFYFEDHPNVRHLLPLQKTPKTH